MDPFCRDEFDPMDLWFQSTSIGCEQLVVFAICCAQKRTEQVWPKVKALLKDRDHIRPFSTLNRMVQGGQLVNKLQEVKMGQYTRIARALTGVSKLRACWAWDDMIEFCGRKTISFIAIYTSLVARKAALDTHVLAGLRKAFPNESIPKGTPKDKATYDRIEKLFLSLCKKRGVACWELDREFWQASKGVNGDNARVAGRSETFDPRACRSASNPQ